MGERSSDDRDGLKGFFQRVVGRVKRSLSQPPPANERRSDRPSASDGPQTIAALPASANRPAFEEPTPVASGRIAISVEGDRRLRVAWTLSGRSVDLLRRLRGPGTPFLQLVILTPEPPHEVRRTVREEALSGTSGETILDAVPPGSRCTVAIGVRSSDRFSSVAHTPVVNVD